MAESDYRETTRRGYRAAIRRAEAQGNLALVKKLRLALVEIECVWDEQDRGRENAH